MTAHDAPDEVRFATELLFTDGLPQMDDEVGYRGAVAARAAGITYRQLDYWARTELVEPTGGSTAATGLAEWAAGLIYDGSGSAFLLMAGLAAAGTAVAPALARADRRA